MTQRLRDLAQLGHVADTVAGWAFPSDGFSSRDGDVRLLRGVNVKPGSTDWTDTVYWDAASYPVPPEFTLMPGDLVLGMDRPFVAGGVRLAAISPGDLPALLLQRVLRIRASERVDRDFLRYVMSTDSFANYLEPQFTGVSVPHISEWQVRRFKIPLPPLDEQRRIARYLGVQTRKIDTLIAEQQRLVGLLGERRLAVATDVLGFRIGMGDRLKWLLTEVDNRAGQRASRLPLMSVSISWGVRRRDEGAAGEPRAEDLTNYKVCRAGDLVVNRMRAFQGALGLAPEEGIVSPDYSVLTIDPSVDAKWLVTAMKTAEFVAEMAMRVKGIGSADLGNARTPRINVSDLGEIRVDVPARETQEVEERSVRTQTIKIDALIAEAERFIELAQERRSALVAAVVTGQIEQDEVA